MFNLNDVNKFDRTHNLSFKITDFYLHPIKSYFCSNVSYSFLDTLYNYGALLVAGSDGYSNQCTFFMLSPIPL